MKKTVSPNKNTLLLSLFSGFVTAGLLLSTPGPTGAAGLPRGMQTFSMDACNDTIHSIQVNKFQSSKKNKIRLYPDARQQVLFFSANGEDKKVYQLYLFDMDGRLVNQVSIRNKETTVLTNMSEGNYLFEVFTDDERIENGHLVVR